MGQKEKNELHQAINLSFLSAAPPTGIIGLDMDIHGYVPVLLLIDTIDNAGKHTISREILEEMVETDDKQRYKFGEGGDKIMTCQGHSIPWVISEPNYSPPPAWKSVKRCKKRLPVPLVINAAKMAEDGFEFGVPDNGVWSVESVSIEYIVDMRQPR